MRSTLRKLGWLYMAALIAVVIADIVIASTTEYGNREVIGCNFYDALVVGIECRGFAGEKAVELVLNWPFFFLYGPLFAFVSLWSLAIAVLVWTPPVYLVVTYLRRRNAT
jgi:hypothetical protein